MRVLKITAKGRRSMAAGLDGISADCQLVMEVVRLAPGAEEEHHTDLCTALVDRYGSPEGALEAIKRGEVKFDKISP